MSDSAAVNQLAPARVVFERLIVEAFRGFNNRTEIDLNASVVIFHGPNGMGKTSVFDALQWLLLGEIPRLREARLRQTDEHIVNAYLPGGQARVEAHARIGDRVVVLSRSGDRSGSLLTWTTDSSNTLHGDAAELALAQAFSASPEMDLETSLTACGLLQQDAARLVLEAKPRDRFAMFSQLLGLGALEDFEEWTKARSKEAVTRLNEATEISAQVERRVIASRDKLEHLRERGASRPAATSVATRLENMISESPFHHVAIPTDRDSAAGLTAAAATLARECTSLAAEIETIAVALADMLSPVQLEEELAAQVANLDRVRGQLEEQRGALNSARSSLQELEQLQASIQRLTSAVMPHVHGDECPVCGQYIPELSLRERLESLGGDTSAVEAAQQIVNRIETDVLALSQMNEAAEASVRETEAQRTARRRLDESVASIESRLDRLDSSDSLLRATPPELLSDTVTWLRSTASAAAILSALSQELIAAIDASAGAEEISSATELAEVEAQWQDLKARLESAAAARRDAELLHRAVQESRIEVVRREFARLLPLAQDVYSRLEPHPTFTEIELVPEMYRAAGTATPQVRDEALDVTANPMLVFSAAQANIVAMSYVIALNWAAEARASMLLLDDPLQAMDDINVLGFADLCRHLRRSRQVIVSTHERRFAELLERKLAPRVIEDRTLVHEFVGWERSGPIIKSHFATEQIADASFRVITDVDT